MLAPSPIEILERRGARAEEAEDGGRGEKVRDGSRSRRGEERKQRMRGGRGWSNGSDTGTW